MILQTKSIEKLRKLINEETEYRSGPNLVKFFNELGFNDSYEQGFPSRWVYTDNRLTAINGTPELDKCIKKLFDPINFVGRIPELDDLIKAFNQYLAFDKWKIVRHEADISFEKLDKITIDSSSGGIIEDEFLKMEFKEIPLDKIGLEQIIASTINLRLDEIKKCLAADAPLSVIFLSGSTLEGILLGVAINHPQQFNQSKSAPKDFEGKVKKFHDWTLNDFIDAAYDLGILKEDVRRFSHELRNFRNYIHPYSQVSSKFNPDKRTAAICWQVLKAAIYQISENLI
jgi:hypothetical protein